MSNDPVAVHDAKALFRNVIDKLLDSIELQISGKTLTYTQFSESADILFGQVLSEVPLEPAPQITQTSRAVQFPTPQIIFEPKPKPGRCAANTLAGLRCRGWGVFRRPPYAPPIGDTIKGIDPSHREVLPHLE